MCIRDRLYLVHWPILVFVRYRADGVLTNHGRAAVLVLTVCLLYTSDAADERSSVDLGGRRIIKKKH